MANAFPLRCAGNSQQRKPEAVFASKVIKYFKQIYGERFWEVGIRGGLGIRSGIPDRLCCIDGKMIAIEFKNPDGSGRLGPKQELELTKLRKAGAVAMIVQSWDDAGKIVELFPPSQLVFKKR